MKSCSHPDKMHVFQMRTSTQQIVFLVLEVILEGLGKQQVVFYKEKSRVHVFSASMGTKVILRAYFD